MSRTRTPKPVADWTDDRHRLGHAGEEAAVTHLEALGWRIEARRFRLGHHDIDLIVRRGTLVAFVEVKTRASRRFGTPLEGLGFRQRRAQTRVAQVWMERHGRAGDTFRFDLVAVDLTRPPDERVTRIEDAWRAER